MTRTAAQNEPEMGRPPAEKPKDAIIHFRTHSEVREAVEAFAREEHRTLAAMSDLLMREALIARLKAAKKDAAAIENLP